MKCHINALLQAFWNVHFIVSLDIYEPISDTEKHCTDKKLIQWLVIQEVNVMKLLQVCVGLYWKQLSRMLYTAVVCLYNKNKEKTIPNVLKKVSCLLKKDFIIC